MPANPLLTIRCPQYLLDNINRQMKKTGKSKTNIVLSMLQHSNPQSILVLNKSQLPKIPAIYFVATSSNKLLYIGKTKNLKQCWESHPQFGQFIQADTESRITWFEFDESDSMPVIEPELLDGYTLSPSEIAIGGENEAKTKVSEIENLRSQITADIRRQLEKQFNIQKREIEKLRSQVNQLKSQSGEQPTLLEKDLGSVVAIEQDFKEAEASYEQSESATKEEIGNTSLFQTDLPFQLVEIKKSAPPPVLNNSSIVVPRRFTDSQLAEELNIEEDLITDYRETGEKPDRWIGHLLNKWELNEDELWCLRKPILKQESSKADTEEM